MAVAKLSVRLPVVAGGIVLPTHLMPIFFNFKLKYKLKTNKAKY